MCGGIHMEQNTNRTRIQPRKKIKKITSTAAIVLCVACFLLGIIIGKSATSGKASKEAQGEIDRLTAELEFIQTQENALIKTQDDKIIQLEQDLAKANDTIAQLSGVQGEEPAVAQEDDEVTASESTEPEEKIETSKSPLKTIVTVLLVIIILACVVFAISIFFKKSHRDDEDDYYEDDYEDDEYDDEEDYEEDEDYDDEEDYEDEE